MKKHGRSLIYFLCVCYLIPFSILFLSGCTDEGKTVSLLGTWYYRTGFERSWLTLPVDENWKKVNAPVSVSNIPGNEEYSGIITFKKKVPAEILQWIRNDVSIAINSGSIAESGEIYLNDTQLGSLGSIEPFVSSHDIWLVTGVPLDAFDLNENNYISIRLFAAKNSTYNGIKGPAMYMGRLEKVFGHYYGNAIVSLMLIAVYFFVGIYHLLLGVRRRSELHYLYFGIFAILISMFLLANIDAKRLIFSIERLPLYYWFDKLPLFFMVPVFAMFVSQLFHRRHRKIVLVLLSYTGLLFTYSLLLRYVLTETKQHDLQLFYPLLIGCLVYVFYEVVVQVIRKNIDAIILIAGIVILFFGAIHDILVNENVIQDVAIMQYAFLVFIVCIVLLLANRFINTSRKMETLNDELDKKLADQQSQNERLNAVQQTITDVTASLSASAEEMSSAADSFSHSSQSQASSVEQMSATMEELMSAGESMVTIVAEQVNMLGRVTERLNLAVDATKHAEGEMNQALSVKNELNKTIEETGEGIEVAASAMDSATARFEEMNRVSDVISDIADQINLLSLNAAIEAARAGEAGRGFAVVADEIGKLADNTTENLKSIVQLFGASREEILNANQRIQAFRDSLNNMLENITSFGDLIEKVAGLIKNTTALSTSAGEETGEVKSKADHVQSSVNEQQKAVAEVTEALQGINSISQQIAGGSEELASSVQEVTTAVEKLKDVLETGQETGSRQ